MLKSAWREIRAANTDVVRRGRLSLVVALITFGPATLIVLLLQLITHMLSFGGFGNTFFDPSHGGDPVWRQHLIWFAGHPETLYLVMGVGAFLFSGWGMAIWWRSQNGPIIFRVSFKAMTIILMLLWVPGGIAALAWAATIAGLGEGSIAGPIMGLAFSIIALSITFSLSVALICAARGLPVSLAVAFQGSRPQQSKIFGVAILMSLLHVLADAALFLVGDATRALFPVFMQPGSMSVWGLYVLDVAPTVIGAVIAGWLLVLQAAIIWRIALKQDADTLRF